MGKPTPSTYLRKKVFELVDKGLITRSIASEALRHFKQRGDVDSLVGFFKETIMDERTWGNNGFSLEEIHFRESVLLRDQYRCVFCDSRTRLEVDHIKPRSLYPDLIYDVENGRSLCHDCHVQTETYGGKIRKLISVSVETI